MDCVNCVKMRITLLAKYNKLGFHCWCRDINNVHNNMTHLLLHGYIDNRSSHAEVGGLCRIYNRQHIMKHISL